MSAQAQLTPQQQLLLKKMGLAPTPQDIAIMKLAEVQSETATALVGIYNRLGSLQDQLARATLNVTEQYEIVDRRNLKVTSTVPYLGNLNYYQLKQDDAATIEIITDSIIQFDFNKAVDPDSPQLAGTTTVYATQTFGVKKLAVPKQFFAKLVSGTGNIWLIVGR